MRYEPNTQAKPYRTLGEQVDYYARQDKIMVVRSGKGFKRIVIIDPTDLTGAIIYLNSVLRTRDRALRSASPHSQSDIIGFISLGDEVDL